MNKWLRENWKAFAFASTMIIAGATGYTALLLDLGEKRSDIRYCEENVKTLLKTSNSMEEKFDICFKSKHKIFK